MPWVEARVAFTRLPGLRACIPVLEAEVQAPAVAPGTSQPGTMNATPWPMCPGTDDTGLTKHLTPGFSPPLLPPNPGDARLGKGCWAALCVLKRAFFSFQECTQPGASNLCSSDSETHSKAHTQQPGGLAAPGQAAIATHCPLLVLHPPFLRSWR